MTSRSDAADAGDAAADRPRPHGLLAIFASEEDPQAAAKRAARMPRSSAEWGRFLLVTLQLVVLVLVLERFQIGGQALPGLAWLAVGGFLIHSLIPLRFRLAFFALLSITGIVLVLSPALAAWVVMLGLALIVLCHAPVPFLVLVMLLLGSGAVLALMRTDHIHAPWSSAIWPVLGSMFMFRLILFLYDRRHGEGSRSFWETLSYFFLLPNVCFPLFPTVDYKTFRRTYYGEDAWDCAQTGILWMFRGVVHLLLYRFIYYYGVLAPDEVASFGDLFRYTVTTYALYLRVSGNFHLATGMLRLFGFALPETHFLYFLSGSINDFWRRANIYWKDFMLKVFYLPTFFKLRRKGGETSAFVFSTLLVVLITWFLHSYQWFWIRGKFSVKWQDGIFWALLGVLMVANTLYENKHAQARGRRAQAVGLRHRLSRSVRVVGTFALISLLWSLWSCETFGGWLDMMAMRGEGDPVTSGPLAALLVAIVLAILVGGSLLGSLEPGRSKSRSFLAAAAPTALSLAGLLALGMPTVYTGLGRGAAELVGSLRVQKLNRLDAASLERGYYEDLIDVHRFNSELWRVYQSKPAGWLQLQETAALRPTTDFLLTELVPSQEITYKEAPLRVNHWGMRDEEYQLEKPANTYRVALLGGSYVMGSGVEKNLTFEALVEDRLNAEGPGAPDRRYEILNFAVGGYSPLQRLWTLEFKSPPFAPDMALYIAHENEIFRIVRHLDAARHRGVRPPYPEFSAILDEAGVDATTAPDLFEVKIDPYGREMLAWTYRHTVQVCRERGVTPVWVFIPTLEMLGRPTKVAWMMDLAREAGFEVIDLLGIFDGRDMFNLRIADWDYHPNETGHRLIADRLVAELLAVPRLFD